MPPRNSPPRPLRRAYVEALLGNVLNPKAALVYLTLVPRFVEPDVPVAGQILTLATVHILVMAAWLSACAGLLHRLAFTSRAARVFARISALTLVALGVGALV